MDIWGISIIVGIFGLLVLLVVIIESRKKTMEKQLSTINDFSAIHKIFDVYGSTGMAVDDNRKKFCLIDHKSRNVDIRVFSYKDMLGSEIVVDDVTFTKAVRSSQLGGALLGKLTFGNVGAIVGGLSGKRETTKKVKRIALRLTVNDIQKPHHEIDFLEFETPQNSFLYDSAMKKRSTGMDWQLL